MDSLEQGGRGLVRPWEYPFMVRPAGGEKLIKNCKRKVAVKYKYEKKRIEYSRLA